jgi:uncharacterized protein (TIGR03437 family)
MSLPISEVLLEGLVGTQNLSSSAFPLIFLGEGLYWTTSIQYESGAGWLNISPRQGYDDSNLRAIANAGQLRAGSYSARVSVIAPLAVNNPLHFRVTLRLRDPLPSAIRAGISSLAFHAKEGDGASPAPQKLPILLEGETPLDWTVSARTLNGGSWLRVAASAGSGSGEVTVSAELGSLPAGVYAGQVIITAPKATNPPVVVPVSLTVSMPKATINPRGISSAADFRAGSIAPGQLLSIAGDHLGPAQSIAGRPSDSTGRFATSLAGVRVMFDEFPAPVLFASKHQVNVQAPYEIAGRATVKVRAESAGFDLSDPVEVPVASAAPGMFSIDGKLAAALHADYSLNSSANPARPGELIQLFLTGQGLTTPRLPTGSIAPSVAPFPIPDQEVVILIDGRRAEIVFAGMAPEAIGLLQVNVRVPLDTTPGDNILVGARIGGVGLPSALQIAVAPPAAAGPGN